MVAGLWMLKNFFCPVFDFGGLFAVISKVHTFESTHFWINVLGADDVVLRLASRFVSRHALRLEFQFHQIRRKLAIGVITVFKGFR